MQHYYIFKTDKKTDKTTPICNGSHKTMDECVLHWRSYMYGFMDAATELLGAPNFGMTDGLHKYSFRFTSKDKEVDYFMLLNDYGKELLYSL